jgi:hypothetical protein
MPDNKTKIDRIHDLLPRHLNSRQNTNWKGLIDAIGQQDQDTADLIVEVRKQLFVKTASRPYIDRLAANNKISRPRLVGMDDSSFRDYIPVLSYRPKQVKLIIDQLLDIFFFKESTTAFITSQTSAPFALQNGWELEYTVDENNSERIQFNSSDFTSIGAAGAAEVVSAINRQAKYSYATTYYDSVTKNSYIRLFTKTVGSKGSLRILGGRGNIALEFNGFLTNAGNGANTQWSVSKVGDLTTLQYVGGASPGFDQLQVGDIVVSNLSGNAGSFTISNIDLTNSFIQYTNLFATVGSFTQTSVTDTKYIRPKKYVAYTNSRRAMTWETSPGEITVEMPTSPPVVKRSLKGSAHMNGTFGKMLNRDSDTSLTVDDASTFPNGGSFWLETVNEIQSRYLTPTENTLISNKFNGRLEGTPTKYTFTDRTVLVTTGDIQAGSAQILNLASTAGVAQGQSVIMAGVPGYTVVDSVVGNTINISQAATLTGTAQAVTFAGNTLRGISPSLPALATLNEHTLSTLSRTSGTVTGTTSAAHGYLAGETVVISGSSGIVKTTATATKTAGNNTLTGVTDMTAVAEGMLVVGAGIPTGTTVLTYSGSTVVMSNNATSSGTGSVTFNENINGNFKVTSVTATTFTYTFLGLDGTTSTAGSSRVERVGLSNSGSKVIITSAMSSDITRLKGAYVWDLAAPFVLSSNKAHTQDAIQAGKIVRLLNVSSNSILPTGGYVVFDYGLATQEGPVRYLYAPTSTTIAIDPSYVFQYNHSVGASVVAINHKGPHIMSGRGTEYPPYVTNPSEAREILEELIRSVKSAGIFVNFLVRYPEQLYATLDVYQSGKLPGS